MVSQTLLKVDWVLLKLNQRSKKYLIKDLKEVPYQGSKGSTLSKNLREVPCKGSKKKHLIKDLKKVPYQGSKKSALSRI